MCHVHVLRPPMHQLRVVEQVQVLQAHCMVGVVTDQHKRLLQEGRNIEAEILQQMRIDKQYPCSLTGFDECGIGHQQLLLCVLTDFNESRRADVPAPVKGGNGWRADRQIGQCLQAFTGDQLRILCRHTVIKG